MTQNDPKFQNWGNLGKSFFKFQAQMPKFGHFGAKKY